MSAMSRIIRALILVEIARLRLLAKRADRREDRLAGLRRRSEIRLLRDAEASVLFAGLKL